MKTRLALVACMGPHDGPWMRARGNETGVRVMFLGEGERIFADMEVAGLPKDPVLLDAEGTFPIPAFDRIRFRKEGVCTRHTTVELVVDG